MKDVPWERVGQHLLVSNSTIVPSSDIRLSETSAQSARVKLSKSSCVQVFAVLIFAFWSWVTKIAKNLDLVKISHYMVYRSLSPSWDSLQPVSHSSLLPYCDKAGEEPGNEASIY